MTTASRVVVAFAIWATLCAGLAGFAMTMVDLWFFSDPTFQVAVRDLGVLLAIALGQGIVILVTGGLLARFSRTLRLTLLLGLVIGAFDFGMYVLQAAVPATELGWGPDLAILGAVAAVVTALGSTRASAA